MTGDPTQDSPEEPCGNCKPMTRALAWFGVAAAGALAAIGLVLPPAAQPWNLSIIGALGLFAAARLSFKQAFAFVFLAIVVKDAVVFATRGWEPYPLSWVYFLGYVAIGYAFLRGTTSTVKIGAATLGASMLFFVVSNFVSWLEQALPYGYSLAGLGDCFAAGIPFYRGTLLGDVVFSAALFGAHALLSQAYFPAERVAMQPEVVE